MRSSTIAGIDMHVAPEAAVGGPLAVVRNGDRIRLSIQEKRIDLLLPDTEIQKRLASLRSVIAVGSMPSTSAIAAFPAGQTDLPQPSPGQPLRDRKLHPTPLRFLPGQDWAMFRATN
jgi:hypothetical protein